MTFKQNIKKVFDVIKASKTPISFDEIHEKTKMGRINIAEVLDNLESSNRIDSKFYIERLPQKNRAVRRYVVKKE